ARHFEIKNTDPKSTNSLITTSIGSTNHHGFVGRFLSAKVDHHMSNRDIPLGPVRTRPKHEIARLEVVEFERFSASTQHRVKIAVFAYPDILLAGISRHVFVAGIAQYVVDKS